MIFFYILFNFCPQGIPYSVGFLVSIEEVDEQRGADQGGEAAHRQFGRREDGAREGVAQQQKEPAKKDGIRNDATVVGAADEADTVWHHQSHKAYHATGGDTEGDHEGSDK